MRARIYEARWLVTREAVKAAQTCFEVDAAQRARPHDVLRAERTGEMMRVDGVRTTDNTVCVTRGVGSEPMPLDPGDELCIVGSAKP